jgi:hypothetical protein
MSKKTGFTQVSDPGLRSFISPAFVHVENINMFGGVNKDGQARVLEPYQLRTLDEYIDLDNLNQELLQNCSSSCKLKCIII